MIKSIISIILFSSSILMCNELNIVETSTLFMDASLSLSKESDFLNFKYLDSMSKFVSPKVSGGIFKLSDYVGDLNENLKLKRSYNRFGRDPRKTLIISFFASYCEPCKKEIPELIEVVNSISSERDDILLVLIGMDTKKNLIEGFIESNEFELPNNTIVLMNPPRNKLSPASIMNVDKLPSLFIVNRDGNIILEHLGFDEGVDIQGLVEGIIKSYEGLK